MLLVPCPLRGAAKLTLPGVGEDPFEILGLPARFDLDRAAVERAYLPRSAAMHPDLASDPEAPRRMAALNEARRVLEDPERRADALLRRLGGPSREQERGLPPGFLGGIMETRQEVEAAVTSGDAAARRRWQQWAELERGRAIEEVAVLFAALGPSPDPAALRRVRVRLNAWRYIERLIEQLDPNYDPARADFRES
jgi:molecular chaperone HscB